MSTLSRQIDVDAPVAVTSATWSHFVKSVMTGHQRLACDELACVDAVRAGLVRFEPASDDRTTVVFTLEDDGPGGPSPQVLEQNMTRDLVWFKDYVERGDNQAGKPSRAEKRDILEHDTRKRHETLHTHIAGEGEVQSYTDRFPT